MSNEKTGRRGKKRIWGKVPCVHCKRERMFAPAVQGCSL